MEIGILPNVVGDIINAKLDAAFVDVPDGEKYRDEFYNRLLNHFFEHGDIPEFKLWKKKEGEK